VDHVNKCTDVLYVPDEEPGRGMDMGMDDAIGNKDWDDGNEDFHTACCKL
jgi:hypothetical protein